MRFVKILVLVCFSTSVFGQILDDSTKLVYGPSTISYINELNLKNNDTTTFAIDTTIYRLEEQSLVERSGYRFQDLGNFGSALFPVFHDADKIIGKSSGFDAYRPFMLHENNVKYYDTKSPYIKLLGYLGGKNKNIVSMTFSSNIKPHWNFGFDLYKITSDKMVARRNTGDRNTITTVFDLFTHYKNQKVPYELLATASQSTHEISETGGTYLGKDADSLDLFEYTNVSLKLKDASNRILRNNFHLFHQYQLFKQFQAYHTLDYTREKMDYTDFIDNSSRQSDFTYSQYYDKFLIDTDSTYDRSLYGEFKNEIGLKGDISSVFYRAYLKWRRINFRYFLINPIESLDEQYLGLYAKFQWRKIFKIIAQGEVMQKGGYELNANLLTDYFSVKYKSQRSLVPFIYTTYFGNHDEWYNDFDATFTNELSGTGNFKIKFLTLKPEVSFLTYGKYLYFDEQKQPQQTSNPVLITRLGGKINFKFMLNELGESMNLDHEVLFTEVTGNEASVFRFPKVFGNLRYYWDGKWFKNKVPFQFGVSLHARTSYYANAYAPYIQQFHLQNELKTDAYFKMDAFINMKLDKFFLTLKYSHLYQRPEKGYFTTPYYPNLPSTIDIGVRWLFFN